MAVIFAQVKLVWAATPATSVDVHEVGFGLMIAGIGGLWIGGGNVLARRFALHRWGQLGSERSIWIKRGFFFLPNWLSFRILLAGILSLLAGGIVSVLW